MSKRRIFQIAKELNISHMDILSFLKAKDINVSNHMAPVDDETYTAIISEFHKDKESVDRLRKEQTRREIHDTRILNQQKEHKKLKLLSLEEQRKLEKKEMNYFFQYNDVVDLTLNSVSYTHRRCRRSR